jgi:hypothetical protein
MIFEMIVLKLATVYLQKQSVTSKKILICDGLHITTTVKQILDSYRFVYSIINTFRKLMIF